jgi:hypothetical protein
MVSQARLRAALALTMATVAVASAASVSTSATARATTALIMGASGISDPRTYPNYVPNVVQYYLAPNSTCQVATCNLVPVITPEGLIPPVMGELTFDPSVAEGVVNITTALRDQLAANAADPVVIFGYSQSSDISTILKSSLRTDSAAPAGSQLSFVLLGNTNRPNGGLFTRFPGLYIPFLNVTFNPPPTPTDTGYATTDIAFQYDPIVDFPQYPVNLLADLNALAGLPMVHLSYPNPYLPTGRIPLVPTDLPGGYTPEQLQILMNDPANRQTYGDTTYITIPANNLPLLQLLVDFGAKNDLGAVTTPIVDLLQPAMRVLIETGYDRTTPYGQPTTAGLFPKIEPTFGADLASAVRLGVRAALTDLSTQATSPTTSIAAQLGTPEASEPEAAAAESEEAAAALPEPPTPTRHFESDGRAESNGLNHAVSSPSMNSPISPSRRGRPAPTDRSSTGART